jgi:hypothetical protein
MPAALLHAPEKERQMIAWACEAYGILLSQRAAEEEKCRQLLLKANDHRQIADTKGVKAQSIKQHFDVLVNLALQGLSNSHEPLGHSLLLCSNSEIFVNGNDTQLFICIVIALMPIYAGSQRQENIRMDQSVSNSVLQPTSY